MVRALLCCGNVSSVFLTSSRTLQGMHPYFRVFHSGINVGAEAGYMIAMAVVLKLAHAALFSHLATRAKTVTLPQAQQVSSS